MCGGMGVVMEKVCGLVLEKFMGGFWSVCLKVLMDLKAEWNAYTE